jgi:hypothetical protein
MDLVGVVVQYSTTKKGYNIEMICFPENGFAIPEDFKDKNRTGSRITVTFNALRLLWENRGATFQEITNN